MKDEPEPVAAPDTSRLSEADLFSFLELAGKLAPAYREQRARNIEEMSVENQTHYTLTEQDAEAVRALLLEVGGVLSGSRPSAGLREAYKVLRGINRGVQERKASAVASCEWAIRAFKAANDRRNGEKKAEHVARVAANRKANHYHARMLIDALKSDDPAFGRLKILKVADQVKERAKGRGSAYHLLEDLIGHTSREGQERAFNGAARKNLEQAVKDLRKK